MRCDAMRYDTMRCERQARESVPEHASICLCRDVAQPWCVPGTFHNLDLATVPFYARSVVSPDTRSCYSVKARISVSMRAGFKTRNSNHPSMLTGHQIGCHDRKDDFHATNTGVKTRPFQVPCAFHTKHHHLGLSSRSWETQLQKTIDRPLREDTINLPLLAGVKYIRCGLILRNGPRSGTIDCIPIYTQPFSHLDKSIHKDGRYRAICRRPHIEQQVSIEGNNLNQLMDQFPCSHILEIGAVAIPSPRRPINRQATLPLFLL
mmetsp:Transcript_9059/g.20926  ORF Transcript_9059/g.20926 Transcript_9059/m.20926 type:complete len:263 (-) Transcript_9059:331-1119(-)